MYTCNSVAEKKRSPGVQKKAAGNGSVVNGSASGPDIKCNFTQRKGEKKKKKKGAIHSLTHGPLPLKAVSVHPR